MHFHLLKHALKTSLPHSKALIMPSKLSPTPFPSIPDSHYKNRILDEVTWLNATNTTNVCNAWARYHSHRNYHAKKMTFQHFFLMDAPVHTLHIIPLNGDC